MIEHQNRIVIKNQKLIFQLDTSSIELQPAPITPYVQFSAQAYNNYMLLYVIAIICYCYYMLLYVNYMLLYAYGSPPPIEYVYYNFKQLVQSTMRLGFSSNEVICHEFTKICDSKRIDKNQILHWHLIKNIQSSQNKIYLNNCNSSTLRVAIELLITHTKCCHIRVYAQKKTKFSK